MTIWYKKKEIKSIKDRGGKPTRSIGYDGRYNGRPIEAKSQRRDNRFRIGEKTHKQLVREKGYYVFNSPGHRSKIIPANKVSKMLPRGKWYKDRTYPHKFVSKEEVWNRRK